MMTCSRRIQFCAGHRVMGHENKCAHLHGHNYVVWVKAEGALDRIGRVIDFSVLKARVGGWIEEYWDHGFILTMTDKEAIAAVQSVKPQKVHLLPYNPTAENMARYLLETVGPEVLGGWGVRLVDVTVYETENCVGQAQNDSKKP